MVSVEIPRVQDVAWFSADHPSVAGAARRATVALAQRLGFAAARQDEIGVAVTEAATNLVRHAQGGRLLLRALRWAPAGDPAAPGAVPAGAVSGFGLQVVTLDSGPGMSDVPAAMRDGTSSAGTLGVGLGALARLSDELVVHSTPGRGTVLTVTFLSDAPADQDDRRAGAATPFVTSRVAGLTRPISGEEVCGDAYAVRPAGAGLALLLGDGLGHGELAARASDEATRIFLAAPDGAGPLELVERVHRGLSHTRGAAVTVALLDPEAGLLRTAGIGNVSGVVLGGTGRAAFTGRPGIAGHKARGITETRHALSPGAVVILHSDGVSPQFDLAHHPGVISHGALVIAATVLRDGALRRDDASVVVAIAGSPVI